MDGSQKVLHAREYPGRRDVLKSGQGGLRDICGWMRALLCVCVQSTLHIYAVGLLHTFIYFVLTSYCCMYMYLLAEPVDTQKELDIRY